MIWQPSTLRTRLLISASGVLVVVTVLLIANTVRVTERMAQEIARQRLAETVPLVSQSLARPLAQGDGETLRRLIAGLVERHGLASVRVYDAQGALLAEADAGPAADGRKPSPGADVDTNVDWEGRTVGMVQLFVNEAFALEARRTAIQDGIAIGGMAVIGSVLLFGVLAVLLTRDLVKLREAARAAAAGDLTVRVPVGGQDEIGQALAAFNTLLDGLQLAQGQVRQSEAEYRDLVERSQQHVLVLDGMRPVYANATLARLLGHESAQTLMAMDSVDALLPQDARPAFAARMLRAVSDGETQRFEQDVIALDGRRLWLDCSVGPTRWNARPACQIVAFDATERHRAEEALLESERFFRAVAEATPSAVFVARRDDGRLLFANARVSELFGLDDDPLEHRVQEFYWEPSERPEVLAQIGTSGSTASLQLRFRRRGEMFWGLVNSLAQNFQGAPSLYTSVFDITSRVRAEQALEASETRYRTLVEQMPEAILVHRDLHIVYANTAAVNVLGAASAAQLAGKPLLDRIHRDYHESAVARIAHLEAEQTVSPPMVQRYLRLDGQAIFVRVSAMPMQFEGRPAVMAVFRDITDDHLREEELRQAQKMEVVGQLTGGVAHDFNNLLTVILGNIELMRRRAGEDAKLNDLLDSISRAAERGATLTQRLLAFSRRQALKPEAIDLNRLVTGMAELLRRTLGESIEVETVLAGGLWPALADPGQLENTLLNLAVNARDAMPGGGKLTIETGNARLDDDYAAMHEEVRPGQYTLVAVSDTGVGMSQEIVERAFDPFFTTKEVGRGSGLGLSMIYGFVKQTGGHVKIYSEPGQGTTVKIYLPRAPSAQPDTVRMAAGGSAPMGSGQRIVVVEDDRSVRELAMAILTNLGYSPIAAVDGPSALEMLATHDDVALLFTDVVLPGGMTGVELANEARRRKPGIRVLYTSGYTENAIIHHGRLDEGVELLEKPFRIDSLARKVQAALADP